MAVTASSNLGVSAPLWRFVLFTTFLLPGLGASGQSPSAEALQFSEVAVKVTDSSGAVIVNAEVVVQGEAETVTTRTDGRGIGVVKLHSGTYTLIASSPGFRTRVADFRVQVPNPSSLDIVLRVEPTDSGGWFPPPDIPIPIDNAELPNEFLPEVPPVQSISVCTLQDNGARFLNMTVEVGGWLIESGEYPLIHSRKCSFRYAYASDPTFAGRYPVTHDVQWVQMRHFLSKPNCPPSNIRVVSAKVTGIVVKTPTTGKTPENEMPLELIVQAASEVFFLPPVCPSANKAHPQN